MELFNEQLADMSMDDLEKAAALEESKFLGWIDHFHTCETEQFGERYVVFLDQNWNYMIYNQGAIENIGLVACLKPSYEKI